MRAPVFSTVSTAQAPRAEPSRSRATGGSGLGLYLVRMIVERHGGTCRIENSADGVRFTALLPRLSTENT